MLSISDTDFIILGDERIDIRSLHDIPTGTEINALAFMLRHLSKSSKGIDELESLALSMRGLSPRGKSNQNEMDATAKVHELFREIETEGLDLVDTGFFTTSTGLWLCRGISNYSWQ